MFHSAGFRARLNIDAGITAKGQTLSVYQYKNWKQRQPLISIGKLREKRQLDFKQRLSGNAEITKSGLVSIGTEIAHNVQASQGWF
jgi:hypothetical protein